MRASTVIVLIGTAASVAALGYVAIAANQQRGLGYSGQGNTGSDGKTGSSGDWGEQAAALIDAFGSFYNDYRAQKEG